MNIDALLFWEKVRQIGLQLPETYEKTAYGTPALYVGKKLFTRLKEDGESLVLFHEDRQKWMQKKGDIFYITDHYLNYPMMLAHLSKVKDADLQELLIHSWKQRATKKLVKEYEANQ